MRADSQFKVFSGQSLAEYGLLIALVGIVSVGAIGVYASSLQDTATTISTQGSNGFSGIMGSGGNGGAQSLNETTGGRGLDPADFRPVTLTLASGQAITLKDFPRDVNSIIETAGANGTTTILASTLEKLVDELVVQGELTPAEGGVLKDLANQGHRIAAIEKLLEENSTLDAYGQIDVTKVVSFEGTDYRLHQLPEFLGDGNAGVFDGNAVTNPLHDNVGLTSFWSKYEEAKLNVLSKDPILDAVVTSLANQIYTMGCEAGSEMGIWYANPRETTTPLKDRIAEKTDLNSMGICQSGGGADTGVQCG